MCCFLSYMFPGTAEPQSRASRVTQAAKNLGRRMLTVTHLTGDMKLRILQYYQCLRFYFSLQQFISMSVDASRIGGLSRLIGMVSRPDGVGGWLPLQPITVISKDTYP